MELNSAGFMKDDPVEKTYFSTPVKISDHSLLLCIKFSCNSPVLNFPSNQYSLFELKVL